MDWLEQPIIAENLEGFLELKKITSTPLMADESIISQAEARYLITNRAVDYINVKLMKTGGLLQAKKLIAFAREYGVKFQIGSMLETMEGSAMGCHLYLSEPDCISTDLNAFALLENQVATGLEMRGNALHISNKIGMGMAIDEALLDKFTIRGEKHEYR